MQQLIDLQVRAERLDSILAARKFNIPKNVSSIKFYTFINEISNSFNPLTRYDMTYLGSKQDKNFFFHEYKLSGNSDYNDLYQLVYAIEQSKELKKVTELDITNTLVTDKEGMPQFLVSYNMTVSVYYSSDDRFTTKEFVENELRSKIIYNPFYPLIRTEIPPNIDNLLDPRGARLLAIIPEGAFIADSKGSTYLLWEGEQVYLGYLTKIDYDNRRVNFIINVGGIIEKIDLDLEQEVKRK